MPFPSPSAKHLPHTLSSHLQLYLQSQKAAILQALQHPPLAPEDENDSSNPSAFAQLCDLLNGSIQRNEGNSCLVLGPRGSGKSRLVERVLESILSSSRVSPIIVRLSAHCQTNDRLAMREIARQVQLQLNSEVSFASSQLGGGKDPQGFLEEEGAEEGRANVDLPPSSQLPMFISALPALGRPVVVILDEFDGFTAHARQALLYCLLDTVQSCRGGAPAMAIEHLDSLNDASDGPIEGEPRDKGDEDSRPQESGKNVKGEHGLLVLGLTSRVDSLTLLEKRVKSRFSHRVIRVKSIASLDEYVMLVKQILCVEADHPGDASDEWRALWTTSVEKFLADKNVIIVWNETFALVKDIRMLCRSLISPVIALTPTSPWLTATKLTSSVSIQRCPKRFPFLTSLPFPQVSLLVAAAHTKTSGHDAFNFEILHDLFASQVRTSSVAPVQIAGGGIGMTKVSRGVMAGVSNWLNVAENVAQYFRPIKAFEHLIATRVFQAAAAPALYITWQFVKYRCMAEREDIKEAVENLGQTNLRKWFSKAQ